MKTFYHGTSSNNFESIRLHGLVPHGGKGADAWILANHPDNLSLRMAARQPSVYLTPKLPSAVMFSVYSAMVNTSEPVVLAVHVSDHMHLEEDEFDCVSPPSCSYRYGRVIPTTRISLVVQIPGKNKLEWVDWAIQKYGIEALVS